MDRIPKRSRVAVKQAYDCRTTTGSSRITILPAAHPDQSRQARNFELEPSSGFSHGRTDNSSPEELVREQIAESKILPKQLLLLEPFRPCLPFGRLHLA